MCNPLIEAHARRLSARRCPAVRLWAHAKQDLAAVGPVRRLAALRTKGEVVIDAVAKGLFDFGECRALAPVRKSRTARTMPRRVSEPGCGRWNTARTPPSASDFDTKTQGKLARSRELTFWRSTKRLCTVKLNSSTGRSCNHRLTPTRGRGVVTRCNASMRSKS